VTWEEVERTLKKKDAGLLVFESHQVLERVDKMGDLFAPLLTLKQKLPKLAGVGKGKAQAISTGLDIAAQAQKTPLKGRRKESQNRSTAGETRRKRQKV
jgi:bifunctional non-homologous end joining protein LigD